MLFVSMALSGCHIIDSIDLKNGTINIDKAVGEDGRVIVFCTRDLEYVKENIEAGVVGVNEGLFFSGKMRKVSPLYLVQYKCPSYSSQLMITRYLLEKGANPDVAFGDMTLLMTQTDESSVENVQSIPLASMLIEYGADVNAGYVDGKDTALDYAVIYQNADYCEW
jgi:hypothetical protein